MPITAAVYCQVFAYLTNYVLFPYFAQHELVKCNLMSRETCCSPKVKPAGIWEANEKFSVINHPTSELPLNKERNPAEWPKLELGLQLFQ